MTQSHQYPPSTGDRPTWTLTVDELRGFIAQAVADALAQNAAPATTDHRPDRLTVREAAHELRCCERQVRRMLSLRRLRSVRMGRKVLIPRHELDRYLASL